MNLNQLPKVLEEIIKDYVNQLEHSEKQEELNKEIRSFNRREYNHRQWVKAWKFEGQRRYYWD